MNSQCSSEQPSDATMIAGFKPSAGKHCWTTALKNILDHHGLHLSEEMFFGLGGGAGFIYWYMKLMAAPFIGTRYGKGTEPLLATCRRLGAEATLIETGSADKGHAELTKQLRDGEPALVFVDMAYLPYMALPEMAHFGGHTIVVFGSDEAKKIVHLADRAQMPFTIDVETLRKARSSPFPPFAPKNKMLTIKYPKRIADLSDGIRQSLADCCSNMLHPPIRNMGLAGLQKWAALVPSWPRQFKGMGLVGCLFNTFLYIEVSGTGGSAFRNMFAQFLVEAAAILDTPALAELAHAFRASAKVWSEIARAALPDSWPALKRMRELCVEKNRVFEEQKPGALTRMQAINRDLDEAMASAAAALTEKDSAPLLCDLKQKILQCHAIEKEAFERLASILQERRGAS
jgi:hypothetical protein